jgi:hypothetical protein
MTEDQKFVLQLCPGANVVSLEYANGIRWVGSLGLNDYDRLQRAFNEDEVWAKLRKELNFKIVSQLER